MTPEAHDNAFAAVSHLPHLLAYAFIQGISSQSDGERFLELAGPGFRDFSRIAASDPSVWRDVFLTNRDQLLLQAQIFRKNLDAFEALMRAEDSKGLEEAIAVASHVRERWQPLSTRPDQ